MKAVNVDQTCKTRYLEELYMHGNKSRPKFGEEEPELVPFLKQASACGIGYGKTLVPEC